MVRRSEIRASGSTPRAILRPRPPGRWLPFHACTSTGWAAGRPGIRPSSARCGSGHECPAAGPECLRNQGDLGARLPGRPRCSPADHVQVHLPDGEGAAETPVLEVVGDQSVPLVTIYGAHRAVDGEQKQGSSAAGTPADCDAGGARHGFAPKGFSAFHPAGDIHGREPQYLRHMELSIRSVQKFEVEGGQHGLRGGETFDSP